MALASTGSARSISNVQEKNNLFTIGVRSIRHLSRNFNSMVFLCWLLSISVPKRTLMTAQPFLLLYNLCISRWRKGFLHNWLLLDFGTDTLSSQHRVKTAFTRCFVDPSLSLCLEQISRLAVTFALPLSTSMSTYMAYIFVKSVLFVRTSLTRQRRIRWRRAKLPSCGKRILYTTVSVCRVVPSFTFSVALSTTTRRSAV